MKEKNKNGLSNQQPIKDDFKSHSNNQDVDQSSIDSKESQDISHDELVNKLDTYSKTNIEENVDDYFAFQKMKAKYLEDAKQKEASRDRGRVNYQEGVKIGLPHPDFEVIKGNYSREDQTIRSQIAKEAKGYYDKNNNPKNNPTPEPEQLKSSFEKARDKGFDIDK